MPPAGHVEPHCLQASSPYFFLFASLNTVTCSSSTKVPESLHPKNSHPPTCHSLIYSPSPFPLTHQLSLTAELYQWSPVILPSCQRECPMDISHFLLAASLSRWHHSPDAACSVLGKRVCLEPCLQLLLPHLSLPCWPSLLALYLCLLPWLQSTHSVLA